VTVVLITRESDRLRSSVEALWQSVCELALTALEDRPESVDLAAVDDVCDQVLELQGSVAAARDLLAADAAPAGADWPEIAALLDQARTLYWRRLRTYEAESKIRLAVRPLGPEARAWRSSVRASLQRCENPLAETGAAVLRCWTEVHDQRRLLTRDPLPDSQPDSIPRRAS
jgi:hypothetical protein